MIEQKMEEILDALGHARQRATYGAVAAAVSASPRMLMKGRVRDQRHCWVVNRSTGLPTGYQDAELHPELCTRPDILETGQALATWLTRMQA
ncbi:MAG: hypothetical protein ABJE47_05630 [bacterium]